MTITTPLTGATVSIEGNKFSGRITIATGTFIDSNTICRADANDEENGYGTDNVNPFFETRVSPNDVTLQPAGEDSSGWEVFVINNASIQPNATYVFNYHVETF